MIFDSARTELKKQMESYHEHRGINSHSEKNPTQIEIMKSTMTYFH